MDKTSHSELQRVFLIDGLPNPLTLASRHLQILDRFLGNTRLRLRNIRDPYENRSVTILQQLTERNDAVEMISAEIHLDETEAGIFDRIAGPESRRNRYFHEFDLGTFKIDNFLGLLKGLGIASIEFEGQDAYDNYIAPPFCLIEVTNDPFFENRSLARRDFGEVERELDRLRFR